MRAHLPFSLLSFTVALACIAGGSGSALATGAGHETAPPFDPRSLPTVVKAWSRKLPMDSMAARPPVIYVASGGRLSAVAVRNGELVWSRDLGEGRCCGAELLATDSTIVASADESLFILNAADGTTRAEVDLGSGASALAGPPVVALLGRGNELVALNPDSGLVTGRLPLGEAAEDLAVQDGYVVLSLTTDSDMLVMAGYRADDLRPIWRTEVADVLPGFERIGKQIFLVRVPGAPDGTTEALAVDPASGHLGGPLPMSAAARSEPDWPAGMQSLPAGGDSPPGTMERLRRIDPATGKPLWTADLPCSVQGLANQSGTLYASCAPAAGRGLLVALTWASGEVRQLAYGLPRGKIFAAAGDLVLVGGDDELAAFSTTTFGPPEAAGSLADEVRRILLDTHGDDAPAERGVWIEGRLRELEALGPAAYPFIARWVPRVGPTSLVAAADVLAAGAYRAGAAPLARRLAGTLEEPQRQPGWEGWNPQFAILRALAVLGGDAEAPAVAALLESGHPATPAVRREALATLAAMRSPAADQAVRGFLARPLAERVAWSPPQPAGAPHLIATLADGRRLLIFGHGYLGNPADLWVAELGRDGTLAAPALFSGQALPVGEDLETLVAQVAAVAGDPADSRVELRNRRGSLCAAFSMARIARDSDGDGLTDLVEQRLRLDPASPDTNRDGLPDAVDPAPNSRLREPINADQEITAALFSQFLRFEEDDPAASPEIAVVVSDFALAWRGRRHLTITLDSREAERFLDETAGGGGVPMVTIRRGEPDSVSPVSGDPPSRRPPLAADEEVYNLSIGRGLPHRQLYRAVMRNLNAAQPAGRAQWVLSELRLVGLR